MVDKKILILFILITLVFSILVYKPFDVVIAGPQMTDIEYFKDELQIIENSTGLKIKYEIYSDIETHLANNHNTDIDIAIIPNPQGVINLGERSVVKSINNIISTDTLNNYYSKHLQSITTSENSIKNYGAFFRLFPNSMIWYNVDKYNDIGSPEFQSYDEILEFTLNYSKKNNNLWCLDIESGASTGWIATNWLEDIILSEYGPELYDEWSNQNILSSEKKILNSISSIGKLLFIDNAVYGTNKRVVRKEFRNNFKNLLSEDVDCVFSWAGHYASFYMPKDKTFGIDYNFFKFPSTTNSNTSIVGIGDILTVLNHSDPTVKVFNLLIDDSFGKEWMNKKDATYIPANKQNKNLIMNPLTYQESKLIKASLIENTFRYDASELMERKIGADALWVALRNYIDMGRERAYREIEEITVELDSNF
jgi:alpha-glucoside transport system substrate-binding protein